MSNYNPYSSYISGLNSMNMTSEDPQEDLDANLANLDFWSSAHFTFDVPSGIGLLDDDFDVSLNKLESTDTTEITQSSTLVQPEVSSFTPSATQAMYHHLLPYQNSSTATRLQPVVPIAPAVTNTSNNYSPIFPTPSTSSNGVKINNPITAQKEEGSNTSNVTAAATTTTTTATATITTPTAAATTPTVTANSKIVSTRKNSNIKLMQSSSSVDNDNPNDTNSDSAESTKRKIDPETAAKVAAEEDKRRRNTAASARFRIKKKLREQALERTAKEMSQKAETLEGRVKELEMEIRWLRGLIVEKNPRLLDVEPPEKKRKTSIKSESSEDSAENDEKEQNEKKKEKSDQKPVKMNE